MTKIDNIYLHQIQLAQEFLNENDKADVSRLQCLLRKIIPEDYHSAIDNIKPHTKPQIHFEIKDGVNMIASDVASAVQHFHEKKDVKLHNVDIESKIQEINAIVEKHRNYEWGIRKLQELDFNNDKVNQYIDNYIEEITDENIIIKLIKAPQTKVQAFALLEAALTTDHNGLIKNLLKNRFIQENTDAEYKPLIFAAIERTRN